MNQGIILGISGHAGAGKDTAADHLVEKYGFVKLSLADELKRWTRKSFGFTNEQLWGPSANRNAEDVRFRSFEAWWDVFFNIGLYGREWCGTLFNDFDTERKAFVELTCWAANLNRKYGPGTAGGLSPRIVLQTLGTEWGRALWSDVWVQFAMKGAQNVLKFNLVYARSAGVISSRPLRRPVGVVIPDVRFLNEVRAVSELGGQTLRLKRHVDVDPSKLGVGKHASETEQDLIPDSAFTHVLDVADGVPAFQAQLDALMRRINSQERAA